MRNRLKYRYRAFTRADLLLLTGTAVVVLPLLVAVLRDVDQQAGVAQCLANLHAQMRATGMYLADYDNNFPWYTIASNGQANTNGLCTWSYAGQTSGDRWITYAGGLYYTRVIDRPLNPYILGGRVEPDLMEGSQVLKRTPVPVARCPGDKCTRQSGPTPPISCDDDVGTSYFWNIQAVDNVKWAGDCDPWRPPGTWGDYVKRLIEDVLAGQAETFTFYLEEPMDWGIYSQVVEVGNHGEFGKHSCGYLDGHADYIFRDTRGWCGPGWEAINRRWIWRPGIPSGQPRYECNAVQNTKNCDPRW